MTVISQETGLPEGWTIRYSRSKKREYFFNSENKESTWEAPEGTNEEKLRSYLVENPLRVRCLHILIKHKNSRRPASHRSEHITITREEAIDQLKKIRETLDNKEEDVTFESLAKEFSDCSSFKRGGDLGMFGKGEMQPSFEKAAFALKIGETSDIVESDSGVHIIKRVA